MADPSITLTWDGPVARLALNRPATSNALDLETAAQLRDAVRQISQTRDGKVVVLTGAGQRFCAGGDLRAMLAATDRPAYVHRLATDLDLAFQELADLSMPVVAGIQGVVAGAGLALMLSADIIVAAAGTRFVPAYGAIGLTCDCGLAYLLPRAIGHQRAASWLLEGDTLDSATALRWGLVTKVVPDSTLTDVLAETAARLAAAPGLGAGLTSSLLRRSWPLSRAEAGALEADTVTTAASHPQARQAMESFTRK